MLCNILLIISGVVETQDGSRSFSPSADTTAFVLGFFNDLFDSLNGNAQQGLTSILTLNSNHISFWKEACQKIKEMEYVEKSTLGKIRKNNPKCLKNWVWAGRDSTNLDSFEKG